MARPKEPPRLSIRLGDPDSFLVSHPMILETVRGPQAVTVAELEAFLIQSRRVLAEVRPILAYRAARQRQQLGDAIP